MDSVVGIVAGVVVAGLMLHAAWKIVRRGS